jgi:ribulose-5-phosphate 4-epimerase/fuculose-1-phosphate aldolase
VRLLRWQPCSIVSKPQLRLATQSLYPAIQPAAYAAAKSTTTIKNIKDAIMNPPVSSPAVKIVKSVREQVSPEEWQVRVDLAACYRLVAMYGYTEMIANHISCRVPGTRDHFLINPYGMLYEEIDASCLIKVDCNGNVLFNASDYHLNAAGFVIHSAIHMARHDVDCVAHTHTPAGMAVSAMECGLLPLAQTSMRFLHIAYHDFEGIADDIDERERLVQHLGNHEAMILRNHGLLVVGRDVPAAFNALYRLERSCEVQVMAMAANTKLVLPSKEILEETYQKMQPRPQASNRNGSLAWAALLRKLDRVDTSYRN